MAETATSPGPTGESPVATKPKSLPPDGSLAGRRDIASRSVIADAAIFTAASYAAQGLLFVAGIVQKGLLGPAATGYWALMQTFWTWLSVATLGAFHGGERQIPVHRGAGDYRAAAAAADTGSSFSVAAMAVLGPVLAAVALALGSGWAPELRYGIMILGLTAPLRLFTDAHVVILQAIKRFDVSAATQVVSALVILTLQTAVVALFGFYGMFLGLVVSMLATYALWKRMGVVGWLRPGFRWRIERRHVRELISYGAPIMIQGQTWLLFMAVDSLIVATFLDVERLGYYSLALSVTSYILLLPKSVAAALLPRMAERFGSTGDVGSIGHYATRVQQVLSSTLVPVFMGAAFFLVPVLIRHALPEFEPGIPVTQVIVAGTFFLALTNMPIKLLITAGYRWPVAMLTAACLAFNAVANLVAVGVLDTGIEGAAVATAVSYFVVFLTTTVYALSKVESVRGILDHVGEVVVTFAYAAAVMYGIDALFERGGGLLADAAASTGSYLLFLVLLAPCFVRAERRYGGARQLWSLAATGVSKLRALRATG
jgi:O-antigen/teichoic acid export membrane protein